jgi:hypothetical protein
MTRVLPQAGRAIVDLAKLSAYCLNPEHPRGRHKARVFRAALGLDRSDAPWLRDAILAAVRTSPATCEGTDRHGERWRVDLALTRGGRTAIVRTLWQVGQPGGPPRLITSFVA